jgi:hypothetical protein
VRLNPKAGTKLLHMVSPDEAVEIIYQPVALAVLSDGRIFLESDSDPYGMGRSHIDDVHQSARAARVDAKIDWERASHVLEMVEGVARRIDKGQPPMANSGS